MTTHRQSRPRDGSTAKAHPPVTDGLFPIGTELMLWRPDIDHRQLRLRILRAAVFSSPATYALLGATLVAIGATPHRISGLFVAIAVLITAGYALVVWVNYQCADYDHQHGPRKQCFLDRTPGDYFYHPTDFRELPLSIVDSVRVIIAAVREAQASPAAAWLAPRHLREIHQVAWDTLYVLDRTRTLRMLATDPHHQTTTAGDLLEARAHLAAVDGMVEGTVNCLHQVTLLVHAWEQKLAEAELRSQLRTEIATIPDRSITSTLRRAESLAENVFAYVTAARDVTNAGPFVWERTQP
jgi:hypothetical protein